MAPNKGIIAVIIAVTIGAVLFMPVSDVVSDNTGEVAVTDEQLVAQLDTAQALDGFDIVDGSEAVEYSSDGGDTWTEATASDYTIDTTPGEITFASSGNISSGDDVRVSYDYEATDSTTTTVVTIVPLLIALLLLVALAGRVTEMME